MTNSTKTCKCGSNKLILLRTHNKKICTDCGAEIKWTLTHGQKLIK